MPQGRREMGGRKGLMLSSREKRGGWKKRDVGGSRGEERWVEEKGRRL